MPSRLETEIKSLPQELYNELMLAFENEENHHVIVERDGKKWFVGVNIESSDSLEIVENKGYWSCGWLK